jgi:hypothetical protein
MKLVESLVKDGVALVKNVPVDRFLRVVREMDESKPRCWVEGSSYRFNSTLVSIETVFADTIGLPSGTQSAAKRLAAVAE